MKFDYFSLQLILVIKYYVMKKYILTAAVAMIAQAGFAQGISQGVSFNGGVGLDLNLYQNSSFTGGTTELPGDIVGSRYFLEGYQLAKVMVLDSDQKPADAFVSYDVLSGIMKMSFQSNGEEAFNLSQARNLRINFDNRSFQYFDFTLNGVERSNYVEVLATLGNGYTLGIVHSKSIERKEVAGNSSYAVASPPRIRNTMEFILIDTDGVAIEFENGKRDVYKNVGDKYQDKIKDYIKDNKIKFDDDFKGLIAVAKYYASLKK